MNKLKHALVGTLVAAAPAITLAQGLNTSALRNTLQGIGGLVSLATSVLIGVAVLVFIWGLVKFIVNADKEEERKQGKQLMLWGLIALVVISSLGAIITLIGNTFGVGANNNLNVTGVQGL